MKTVKVNPVSERAKDAYLKLVTSEGWNWLGGGFVVRLYPEGAVTLEFRPGWEDTWRLSFITTSAEDRGKGLASRALKEIAAAADQAGIAVTLDVDPQGKGGLTKAQLFQWYARHGFKRQPYDMQPKKMSSAMRRTPTKPVEAVVRFNLLF